MSINPTLPTEIDSVIDQLSEPQLMQLHDRVVDRIKLFRDLKTLEAKSTLSVGDYIKFEHQGTTYFGTVTKKNTKTVSVLTEDMKNWNISPNLLTKIQTAD